MMNYEVNCMNCMAVLDYVKAHNNGDCSKLLDDLDPEINALDDPEGYLRDPHNWVSSTVASKLYKRARLILKDEMAAYKIAEYAIEHTFLGYMQKIIIKAFWSTGKALKHVQKINDNLNRNKKIELVETVGNSATIRLHWNPQMDVSKDLCLMNQGAYTFLPRIWGGDAIILNERKCFFEGAPYCEYHVKWTARNRLHEIYSQFFRSKSVLKETIEEMEADKKVIELKYEEVNRLNLELNQKIKQLLAIQETGKAILSVLDLNQLLTVIMNLLSNVCRIDRAVIMLVNEDERCLEYLHGVGFEGEIPDQIKNYRVPLERLSNLLARVANTGRAEHIPEIKNSQLRKDNIILMLGKPTSAYVVPLITRSKVIGVLATDAAEGVGVPLQTRETLDVFSPQIAIAIENARLYSRLQEQVTALKRSHTLLSRVEKFSFLGNLSARLAHEIKNPLTAIRTFIQLFPRKYDDAEFRKDFYQIAIEETDRVNNLINELLDLVKTRESHFALSNLHVLIDKMILLVSPQTKSQRIEMVRKLDPNIGLIWMDEEKLKQVVLNILSNAVEFTPDGGKIEVSTCAYAENQIRVEITNNGPGIPPEQIDKIFDPYFTTKHTNSNNTGTGLGLFIAHQNMQDHGGTIEVKSRENEDTTFILTLNADENATPLKNPSKKKSNEN